VLKGLRSIHKLSKIILKILSNKPKPDLVQALCACRVCVIDYYILCRKIQYIYMTPFTTTLVKRHDGHREAKSQNIIAIVLSSGPRNMRLMSSEVLEEGRGGGAAKNRE
jgi:hypothetical protein